MAATPRTLAGQNLGRTFQALLLSCDRSATERFVDCSFAPLATSLANAVANMRRLVVMVFSASKWDGAGH